jgi:hypothetical protein
MVHKSKNKCLRLRARNARITRKRKRKIKETLCFEVLDVLFVGAGGFSCSLKALLGGVRIKVLNFYQKF